MEEYLGGGGGGGGGGGSGKAASSSSSSTSGNQFGNQDDSGGISPLVGIVVGALGLVALLGLVLIARK